MKVAHLTSVHPRYDTRIFLKQCKSLSSYGYSVCLVVADGKGNEHKERVRIYDVGISVGRLNRMSKTVRRIFRKAIELDADMYHLHDPELIPIGLRLRQMGKRVIFDSHEDVPKQMLSKPYFGPIRLRMVAEAISLFERYACRKFDGIIAATPSICEKFLKINQNTIDINNFPLPNELDAGVSWNSKRLEVCYVGGIASIRGIREVVKALDQLQSSVRLNLVGNFSEPGVEAEVKALPGWQRVNDMGFLSREGVRSVLGRSIAGIVTFHSLPNHTDALPNKMFEYMSAGVPVIASFFPLWREIIEGNNCGICVDPMDPAALAQAIDNLAGNAEPSWRMGMNGRKAVMTKYNWPVEEKKLLAFYADLLQKPCT